MKQVLLLAILLLSTVGFGQQVNIGDILCIDESIVSPQQFPSSGKTALGIVFYVDNTDSHGWAVSLDNQSSSIMWCSSSLYGSDLPELPNYENAREAMHDLNGYANTGIIRSLGSSYDFPAAWSVDYNNGWYLPSAGQLRYLYSYAPEINSSLLIAGGKALPYQSNTYWWSSTEFTGFHAYDMNTGGSLGDYVKDNNVNYPPSGIGVRQIRNFTITNSVHSTYHLGDLITNNDGSRGIVFYVNPDQTDGWIVALHDAATSVVWGDNSDVPSLTNQTCAFPFGALLDETSGFSNTESIRSHLNGMNNAANVVDLEHGWYLPTAGQLSKLFGALAFIEDKLLLYGNTLAEDYYWSSSEANESEAFALSCAPMMNVRAGHFTRCDKAFGCCVRAIRNIQFQETLPFVGSLNQPKPFCAGGSPVLGIPSVSFAVTQGWQISPTIDFSDPIPYNGEPIDIDKDGWFLRYYASNEQGTTYSNTVTLNVLPAPYISEIQGKTHIYYLTNGTFNYSIDPVEGCLGYEWHIDNSNWLLDASPNSPECSVYLNSPGVGTLTVRVYTECGFIERSLYINHDLRPDIVIYPNPTKGDFNIVLYGLSGETVIKIFDYLGQFIGREIVNTDVDGTTVPYSLAKKAAGVYTVQIINQNYQTAKSVIKDAAAAEKPHYLSH